MKLICGGPAAKVTLGGPKSWAKIGPLFQACVFQNQYSNALGRSTVCANTVQFKVRQKFRAKSRALGQPCDSPTFGWLRRDRPRLATGGQVIFRTPLSF
jgi:hypothetical protein